MKTTAMKTDDKSQIVAKERSTQEESDDQDDGDAGGDLDDPTP